MMAASGPIEFSGAEIAFIFAIFGLVPPFFVAVVGCLIHAVVNQQRGRDTVVWDLFLKWWLWCTLGWVVAWFIGWTFT